MKVLGLDGKEYYLNTVKDSINDNKSQLHLAARQLLHSIFPLESIIEEVKIPRTRLFIDFFIPTKEIVVEVHGEQHYKYNTHFFKNKLEFFEAVKRDQKKIDWCEINNFTFIALPFNEKDKWREYIENRNS